jgi:hypothetical protein
MLPPEQVWEKGYGQSRAPTEADARAPRQLDTDTTLGLWLWLLAVTRPEIPHEFNLSVKDVERFVTGQASGKVLRSGSGAGLWDTECRRLGIC